MATGYFTSPELLKIKQCTYEDFDLAMANNNFFSKAITFQEWGEETKDFFDKMQSFGRPWGFKDPRIAPFLGLIIDYFKHNLTIIRVHRTKALVINSMRKKLGWTKKQAQQRYNSDEKILGTILAKKEMPHILINYKKSHESEDDVADFLEEALFV